MKSIKAAPAKNVDAYVAGQPKTVQAVLNKLRSTIKTAAPKAEEVISYQMPAYEHYGMLVYFAAWPNHIGFYPTPGGIEAFKKELAAHEMSKGTIKFPLDKAIPYRLISKIVKFRVKENEMKASLKKSAKSMTAKIRSAKPTGHEQVNEWMDKLDHEMKPVIDALRKIIKASGPKLNERIKWNAPSYYYKEDIVTFGPTRIKDKIILVFHHPKIVKIKSDLLKGDYKDRRLSYFNSLKEVKENKEELERIIKESIDLIDK